MGERITTAAITPARPASVDIEPSTDLVTSAEVADMARTSPATVRYWRHIGKGPHGFKVGKKVLYRRVDVIAWLDAAYPAADTPQGAA